MTFRKGNSMTMTIANTGAELEFLRKRLKELIENAGIAQRALAARAGLTPTALSNILIGRTERVDLLKFLELLKALEISVDDFFEGMDSALVPLKSRKVMVPMLGEVACGPGAEAEGIREKEGELIEGTSEDKGALALCVTGRSMEPRYQPGDILFWRRIEPQIVLPGTEQAQVALETIKRYHGWTCILVHEKKPTLKILDIRTSSREIPAQDDILGGASARTARLPTDYVVYLRAINPEFATVSVRLDEELRIQGYVYKLVRQER